MLRDTRYDETVDALQSDPIVVEMAADLPEAFDAYVDLKLLHPDGRPTFRLITLANRTYRERGGKIRGHLGAVAEAVIGLRR